MPNLPKEGYRGFLMMRFKKLLNPIAVENNRVVIDTNVFISAIIGRFSYPYKICLHYFINKNIPEN